MKRIAIVHDWLPVYGGAERVLEQMLHVFPEADVFTLIDTLRPEERGFLGGRMPNTSFVQNLPGGRRYYRHFFPLMPMAVEAFDLSSYDVVISSSYAFAKGVLTGPNQLHVCYCHSPIRYAWDLQHQYLQESRLTKGPLSWIVRALLHYIRLWDVRTSAGVDLFLANSRHVARRIAKVYRRDARVVHPPVDCANLPYQAEKEDFYLTASRCVPYKKMSTIVEAFRSMPQRKLIVIGDGPELEKLKARAGANVEVLGWQPSSVLHDHMRRARAFVFAAEEDFGIAPVEAQACGTPVIAYGVGGVTESVRAGETGVFFPEQTSASICAAVEEFEQREPNFRPERIRRNAERFSVERFRAEFRKAVAHAWAEFHSAQKISGLVEAAA